VRLYSIKEHKHGRRLIGALLVLAAVPGRAAENLLEFNLGRGFPWSSIQAQGSSERSGSRGTAWSADFLHRTAPYVAWGLGGGQFRSNDNVSQTFLANAISTITSKTTSVLLLARTDVPSSSTLTPYFIVGLGWVRNTLSVAAVPGATWTDTGTTESRPLLHDSKDTFGYAYGLGLDYALNDRLVVGIEARYESSLKSTYNLTPAGSAVTGLNSIQSSLTLFTAGVKVGIKY